LSFSHKRKSFKEIPRKELKGKKLENLPHTLYMTVNLYEHMLRLTIQSIFKNSLTKGPLDIVLLIFKSIKPQYEKWQGNSRVANTWRRPRKGGSLLAVFT
jgi:hypothetical protein